MKLLDDFLDAFWRPAVGRTTEVPEAYRVHWKHWIMHLFTVVFTLAIGVVLDLSYLKWEKAHEPRPNWILPTAFDRYTNEFHFIITNLTGPPTRLVFPVRPDYDPPPMIMTNAHIP